VKKALSSVLAILLALAMLCAFAACKKSNPETSTDPDDVTTEDIAAGATTADDDITEPPTETEPTTEETTTEPEVVDPFVPPADLDTLSKADKLAYFNLVANRVRTERPGFTENFGKVISDLTFTGVVRAFQGIIDGVVRDLTGQEEPNVIAKGSDNSGKFLSSNANASDLKESDVTSISAKKSGSDWVLTVKIKSETNPAKGTGSANSRIYPIASRKEVLDEITGVASIISADENKATLVYKDGTVNLTVNEKGQVTAADYSFKVDATAPGVKISFISTDVTAVMTTTWKGSSFKW